MQSDAPDNVADEDGDRRATKRQRISRACAQCRYAKLRCDGQQPTCTTCRHQGKRCTYETSSKRRGLRTGYVRALELLWGLTFRELENVESIVDGLLGRLSKQDLTASSDRTDGTTPASALLDRWKQSDVARHIEDLLDDEGDEGGLQDELQQPRSSGKPAWVVVSNEVRQAEQPQSDIALVETALQASLPSAELHPLQVTSPSLQPPSYSSQLLQIFFRCTQSWLPILERHITLKTAFRYSMDSSSLAHGDRSALWAVHAYAATTLSHHLNTERERQHAQVHRGSFYAQAYSMLPLDSDQSVELGHIQCVALLVLTRLSSGATRAAWRLMKIAIQMLRELTEQYQPAAEQDALARAWLACFVLDAISSACCRTRPSLHFDDVVGYLQVDENGLEEWQPWQPPRILQNQDGLVEITTEVPTHSVGMLVLQAKLSKLLSRNLHLQNASWELNNSELEEFDQNLSSYLSRTGMDKILAEKDLDLQLLPSSFITLSIIYTTLMNKVNGSTKHPLRASQQVQQRVEYPLLSHVALERLLKDDQFRKNFPVLHLLSTELLVDDFDRPPNVISNQSNRVSQQIPRVNALVPGSEMPQIDVGSGQSVRDMQEHSSLFSASLRINYGATENLINEQDRGSVLPSMDTTSYIFPTDAPFLDFMDDLDDRSM